MPGPKADFLRANFTPEGDNELDDDFDDNDPGEYPFVDGRKRSFLGNDGCYQIDAAGGCD